MASGVTALAQAGILNDLPEPGSYIGFPAHPVADGRRNIVLSRKLPDMLDRIKALEKRLAELEKEKPEP